MRAFHLRLVLFATLIAFAALILDDTLDKRMKMMRYDDASVWNDIYAGRASANILICGSSRAATHIDATMIEKASGCATYNLGMMGHNFILEDARYRIYRQHNRKPKLIIFSLDYESLQMRPDLFHHTQFIAWLQDSLLAEATGHYEGYSRWDYCLPLLRYAGEQELILQLIKDWMHPERNRPDRVKGFYGRNISWSKETDYTLDTLQAYTVHPDTLSLLRFRRFIESCKAENIALVFVHTPVHPRGQEKVRNRKEIMRLYQQFSTDYTIPFVDYASDSISCRQALFMNSTHLNATGAAVFTRRLIQDLMRDTLLPDCR